MMNLSKLNDIFATMDSEFGDLVEMPLPPVDKWQPRECGDIGLEIRKDGSWWHQNTRFNRQKLVKLFSRILRKDDDGQTYLVTPVEKVLVHVEDAHFTIIRADLLNDSGQKICFSTNLGERFIVDKSHYIWVNTNPNNQEPRPYVMVRNGLFALISRNVFYELVEWGEFQGEKFGIYSDNEFFELGEIV